MPQQSESERERERGREREERCQAGQMHAVRGGCCLLLPPLPSLIVIAILHTFAARKFPHFHTKFFLLDFCLATFFHIIKADYLGRRIVQRVLFVSMHVRKCTGQWTVPAPPLPLPHPLSLCLSFATAFMMCGCLVNPVPIMRMWVLRIPNGHFPFRPLCPQASSLYIYTHTHHSHTHIQTVALCSQRTRLSTKYWLQASFEATIILLLCFARSPFALLSPSPIALPAVVCPLLLFACWIKIKLTPYWPT